MFVHSALRILAILIAYHASLSVALGFTGGAETSITAHPYVVSLQTANGTHICGGALIKKKIVVTTAQCFVFYDPKQIFVRVGNNNYDSDGELIPIDAYRINENFDFTTMDSDVAVVKLSKSVKNSRLTREIKIAGFFGPIMWTSRSALLTGWGESKQLEDVHVRIIDYKKCRSGSYVYTATDITEKMVCAEAVNKSVCGGESGSPLVLKGKLIGLLSWGYGCGNQGNPAVYTNVHKLRKWIKNAVKKL
ncbi:trypsin-like [Ceratitis capitata]|uniref:trypsin-like n=1 Tax=Ceratitis capitata TaxID=7213 RepID=UPI0003299DCB|nr:trypsin-like [Ceratitis capitata]